MKNNSFVNIIIQLTRNEPWQRFSKKQRDSPSLPRPPSHLAFPCPCLIMHSGADHSTTSRITALKHLSGRDEDNLNLWWSVELTDAEGRQPFPLLHRLSKLGHHLGEKEEKREGKSGSGHYSPSPCQQQRCLKHIIIIVDIILLRRL